jgi:hypothetical protein
MKSHAMKITALYVESTKDGLYVKGILSVPTKTQYDDVTTKLDRSYKTRNIILALWKFRRDVKVYGARLQSMPGEYSLTPTDSRKGLLFT